MTFNLGDLFPNLGYRIVAALDRADLDVLYQAQATHLPGQLGENATTEFVLRHVFGVAPELIKQQADLLRVLLRRHYHGQRIPAILDDRFIRVLRQNGEFAEWPLESIIPDREAFFAFLQERWPAFLDRVATHGAEGIREESPNYGFEFPGPRDLPFDHHDVRVFIDNLFLEGFLQAVEHDHAESLSKSWVGIGVVVRPEDNQRRRIEGLLQAVESTIPSETARHDDWLHFAYRWAELVALELEADSGLREEYRERLNELKHPIDSALTAWVQKRYAGLVNLPPVPPVMLHHLPRFFAREIVDDRKSKVAFLLVDGLSLDQWIAMREVLQEQEQNLRFREDAVFAWIPTITSVSRQAAFAGKPPIYFPSSIYSTDREPALWNQFWVDQGLTPHELAYAKGLGDGELGQVSELVTGPKTRVVGLVIDKVDKIMHGMELGAAGMHNQVRQWAKQGFMLKLFQILFDAGFRVYLSSDHGNIEANGCGRPAEGVVADLRGERVRVYPDPLLRKNVHERFPDALEWPPVGLPEDYLPLVAPDRAAFVRESEQIVGHGGISVEELIVPLVQIERRGG